MSDVEDTWPVPDHNAGKPKHLHAIGVLSMNFNQYERGLYLLYKFHLSKKRLPRGIIELYYFSLSERLRLAAIQNVFEEFERSDKVKAVLDSNLKFFDWYSQVRNSILHCSTLSSCA